MEKIKNLVADVFSVDKSLITSEKKLKEDLGADSLKFAELLIRFETEYNVSLEDMNEDELMDIKTVADIEELVKKYIK